jgi:hypothetical protein
MTTATKLLLKRDVDFEPLPHPEVHSAIAEAMTLHLPAREVVKPVVVIGREGPALMVLPATCRLDMKLAGEALGDPHVRLATEHEIAQLLPEFELARSRRFPGSSTCPCTSTRRSWSSTRSSLPPARPR